jgi:tetratricopeptide (TPR) repeat protein
MRFPIAIGLNLLLLAVAARGDDKPIPQDHARMEKRARERLEWNRSTLQAGYDKAGKKDPRWDKPARDALELAARMFSLQVEPRISPAEIQVPASQAVAAGCDDPLILYIYARTSVGRAWPGPAEFAKRTRTAAEAMAASACSPFRRAVALMVLAEQNTAEPNRTPEQRQAVERSLDAALDLLPKSVAEDPRNVHWEEAWYREINNNIALRRTLGSDYKAAYDAVDAALAKVRGIEPLRLAVRGNMFYMWGWEARTNAVAARVSEEKFRTFEGRLSEAQASLKKAWELNPDQPRVATLLLDIEKAIGEGDRAAMETWFERAMTADGNDESACLTKLDWLDPKWHGDNAGEEMLAFGKACAATKNWSSGITLLAADAHLHHCGRLQPAERLKHRDNPEVWSEIQSVYDEYLKHFPDDAVRRSKYAFLCYLGAHYPEAHAQFQAVGDRLTIWPTFPRPAIALLKQYRNHAAQMVAGNPGSAPAVKDDGGVKIPK